MFPFATVLSLGLAIVLPQALAANNSCEDSWMFIDIHYRQVDARPDTFSYGLFIGVGVNSQNQSLWPSVIYNETRIASNDFCASASPPAHCTDPRYTHGHYGADVSSSWQQTPQYTSLDANFSSDVNFNITYGQDQLNMFTHFFDPSPATDYPLQNHPITVLSDATSLDDVFFDSGTLGLGASSTVIKQLIDQGRTDRNVVSMYLGTAYPRAGGTQNGSIVIGGYDAGRFVGEPHQYPFEQTSSPDTSPLKVHVKQMALVTEDGTTIPFVTDDGFDGHISTHQYPMELPHDIIRSLSTAIGATPANNDEGSLKTSQPFSGNLTITLDDGYEITFPSEWISNASNITPFSALTLDTDNTTIGMSRPLIFGASFLHHLYMTIDYDASNFYLADAKVYDNYVQPQPLCTNQVPVAMAIPHMSRFVQSGLIGAILGSLIGGTALISVIFFYLRKRAAYKRSSSTASKMEGGGAAGSRRKSSMRKRPMFRLDRITGKRSSKDVTFGDVKRISISDSETDTSPPKNTTKVSVSTPKDLYEMNRVNGAQVGINNNNQNKNTNSTAGHTPTTNPNLYHPSPLNTPFTATTPHTGNPLLGTHGPKTNAYAQYNDRDDSDIPIDYRHMQHQRQSSDPNRNRLGLKVDTTAPPPKNIAAMKATQPGSQTQSQAQGKSVKQKQRLAPLDLSRKDGVAGTTETDSVRLSPVNRSFLRKVFPAS